MKRFYSSVIVTIFSLFIPCLLLAQQEEVTLGEIVVTATRDAEAVSYTHLTLPTTPYV